LSKHAALVCNTFRDHQANRLRQDVAFTSHDKTTMKLAQLNIGLLINVNKPLLKKAIKRLVL
jgi:hypothetical protein